MKIEKLMVDHFFDKGLGSFKSIFPRKCGRTLPGLESGPERGGIVSVIKLAMAKQVYKKLIILRLD